MLQKLYKNHTKMHEQSFLEVIALRSERWPATVKPVLECRLTDAVQSGDLPARVENWTNHLQPEVSSYTPLVSPVCRRNIWIGFWFLQAVFDHISKTPMEMNSASFPRCTEWLFHQPEYYKSVHHLRKSFASFLLGTIYCSSKIGAHIMQTGRENVIHVSLFLK